MQAAELLKQAQCVWLSGKRALRDSHIEVGRLLRQFLLARIAEGEGKNESERRALGATRQAATFAMAKALQVRIGRVNELMRVAVAVELFGPDIGGLSYSALRALQNLIYRPHRGQQIQRGKKQLRDAEIRPLQQEVWAVRPGIEDAAKALVRDALAQGWGESEVIAGVKELARQRGANVPQITRVRPSDALPSYQMAPRTATNYDRESLLDTLTTLLLATDDPDSVLNDLRAKLNSIRACVPIASEREERLKAYEKAARGEKPIPYTRGA